MLSSFNTIFISNDFKLFSAASEDQILFQLPVLSELQSLEMKRKGKTLFNIPKDRVSLSAEGWLVFA